MIHHKWPLSIFIVTWPQQQHRNGLDIPPLSLPSERRLLLYCAFSKWPWFSHRCPTPLHTWHTVVWYWLILITLERYNYITTYQDVASFQTSVYQRCTSWTTKQGFCKPKNGIFSPHISRRPTLDSMHHMLGGWFLVGVGTHRLAERFIR